MEGVGRSSYGGRRRPWLERVGSEFDGVGYTEGEECCEGEGGESEGGGGVHCGGVCLKMIVCGMDSL